MVSSRELMHFVLSSGQDQGPSTVKGCKNLRHLKSTGQQTLDSVRANKAGSG